MMDNFLAQEFGKSQNYTDIPNRLFKEYNVKKGLRNDDGTGVRVGLTRVSDVVGYKLDENGVKQNAPGELYYRGYKLTDIVNANFDAKDGFEEVMFLLLFGFLPNKRELDQFTSIFHQLYALPDEFLEMNMLRMPSQNLMNRLQHAVLTLYSYDDDADNTDVYPTLLKGMQLCAKLPAIAVYAYQTKMHYFNHESLIIHYPRSDYSIAENILYMLREDRKFTRKEAALMDTMLMIHADHGGGNNSTFTNVVVSSTGTDLYSAVAASIGSLKGPKHGGANVRVAQMMDAIIQEIGYTEDDGKIRDIVNRILDKDFYDKTGLIYGFGHAVYTITDPRAELLRDTCRVVAEEKGRMKEYEFYVRFEKIARKTVEERKGHPISNNVDFYSGFAYDMLGVPRDLFTPLFVCARSVGWVAHNIENKLYDGRIMRPATKFVGETLDYVPIRDR